MRVFIIAEAGVNHNGSIDLVKKTISFPLKEYWKDIGRLSDYEKANKEFLNKF